MAGVCLGSPETNFTAETQNMNGSWKALGNFIRGCQSLLAYKVLQKEVADDKGEWAKVCGHLITRN